jgi:hypothetical protein
MERIKLKKNKVVCRSDGFWGADRADGHIINYLSAPAEMQSGVELHKVGADGADRYMDIVGYVKTGVYIFYMGGYRKGNLRYLSDPDWLKRRLGAGFRWERIENRVWPIRSQGKTEQ